MKLYGNEVKFNAENLEAKDDHDAAYYLSVGRNTVNAEWTVSNQRFRELTNPSSNLKVGAWIVDDSYVFNQFWCLGVEYVTSNNIRTLMNFNKPFCIRKDLWPIAWYISGGITLFILLIEFVWVTLYFRFFKERKRV